LVVGKRPQVPTHKKKKRKITKDPEDRGPARK